MIEKISSDIKAAMLAKDKDKLNALRAIKSALLLEATKDGSQAVSDETAMKLLMKLHKQRKEAAEIYIDQSREDLAGEELKQAEVIEAYLPKQMSAEEIEAEVKSVIESAGASSMSDMGKVMGMASKNLAGKADGKTISEIVKRLLA